MKIVIYVAQQSEPLTGIPLNTACSKPRVDVGQKGARRDAKIAVGNFQAGRGCLEIIIVVERLVDQGSQGGIIETLKPKGRVLTQLICIPVGTGELERERIMSVLGGGQTACQEEATDHGDELVALGSH